jgi:integrase
LFTGPRPTGQCITTRQYSRLLSAWVASIGLDPKLFGTHSLRRTKATLIYRRTGILRAAQLLLGHTKIESTVRHLGIDLPACRTLLLRRNDEKPNDFYRVTAPVRLLSPRSNCAGHCSP